MSMTEILVVLGGLGLGYLVVSMFTGKRTRPPVTVRPAAVLPEFRPEVWHEVLGVAPQASAEDIRAAYQRLMSQYHPDKVATLGPELRELAERKTKQIAQAYDDATAASGSGSGT